MTKNIVHFFLYLDYDKILEELPLNFEKPIKDKDSGIYSSAMTEPIYFYLPKSKITEIYQDDHDRSIARYMINTNEHSEILYFTDNLDLMTLEMADRHSEIWFNKNLEKNTLQNHLNNICDNDEDENVYLDLILENLNLIEEIDSYNNNCTSKNILVKLDSIEFFKKNFKLKLILDCLDTPEIFNEDHSNEVDFDNLIDENNSDEEIHIHTEPDNIEKNSITDSQKINKETIDDLAENISESYSDNNLEDNNSLVYELESLISEKKKEKKNLLINSKRAEDTAKQLFKKAQMRENEIESLSHQLKNRNNIKSISNIL